MLKRLFQSTVRFLDAFERLALTVLVLSMVFLALAQIIVRNLWQTGWNWVEPFLGMGLLWITMLGALAATGQGRHIAMDLVSALCPKNWTAVIQRFTSLFACAMCVMLAWAAGHFIGFYKDDTSVLLLGQPVWKYYTVIPVAFWLMALRFAGRVILPHSWLDTSTGNEGGTAAVEETAP